MTDRYESPFRRGGLHHLVSHPDANDPRVALARTGDAGAFVSILSDHDADTRTFVWSVLGDRWLMDDVLDTAYAEAFRSSAGFRGQTSLRAWLHRHCWSASTVAAARATMDWYVDVDGSPAPADVETAAVRRAWGGLPLEQRAALALVTVGGFSYDEAAEVCGARPATVSSWAAWGWDTLRSRNPGVDLRLALRRDVPDHREGFWGDLRSTLQRAAVSGAMDPDVAGAGEAAARSGWGHGLTGPVPRQPGPDPDDAVPAAASTSPVAAVVGAPVEPSTTVEPTAAIATSVAAPAVAATGADPTTTDPAGAWRPATTRRELRAESRGTWRRDVLSWRWTVPLAVAVAVAGSVVTSLVLSAGGDDSDGVERAATDGGGAPDGAVPDGGDGSQPPTAASPATGGLELTAVDSAAVVPMIEGAGGYAVPGVPRPQAHTWADTNGTNILVLSVSDDGPPGTDTLHMTLASEQDGEVVVQRTLVDPGTQPCDAGFSNDFLTDSVRVSDSDGDGVGEVTIGWAYACGPAADPQTVKLTLLEGSDKYILRGTGYLDEQSARAAGGTAPTFAAEPAPASWPDGSYDHAVGIFQTIAF